MWARTHGEIARYLFDSTSGKPRKRSPALSFMAAQRRTAAGRPHDDTPPELSFYRDEQMLVQGIGMDGHLDPLTSAGTDGERRRPRIRTHTLCCSCMYFLRPLFRERTRGSMNLDRTRHLTDERRHPCPRNLNSSNHNFLDKGRIDNLLKAHNADAAPPRPASRRMFRGHRDASERAGELAASEPSLSDHQIPDEPQFREAAQYAGFVPHASWRRTRRKLLWPAETPPH